MKWWQRWWYRVWRLPLPDAAVGIPAPKIDPQDTARLRREQQEQQAALSIAIATYRMANMERPAEVVE